MQSIDTRTCPARVVRTRPTIRRTTSIATALIVLMLHLSPTVLAEDTPPLVEEAMLVLGSRTPIEAGALPGLAGRLDADALRNAQTPFVADLLRTLPGTNLSRSGAIGGLTQVRLRGSEANQTLVLLDGFELNDPANGSEFDFAHLRGTTVSGVEVLPGPAGALWGSDALAGAIALTTPVATTGGISTGLRLAGAAHDTIEATGRMGHAGDRHGVQFVVDRFETDGTNVSEQGDERDGYRLDTIAMAGHLDLSETWTLRTTVRHVDARIEFDPAPFPAFVPADGARATDLTRTLVGVRAEYTPERSLRHAIGLEWLESDYDDAADGMRTNGRGGERRRAFLQSTAELPDALGGRQRLTLMGEIEEERFEQDGAASIFGDPNQDQSLRHGSALAEWRWRRGTRLSLMASARRDWNDAFRDADHYRLGLRTALPAALGDAWVTWATGTKNPGFVERFGFTPDTFAGNPALRPERSRAVELGWTRGFAADRVLASLVWHRTRLEDEIDGFVFDPATNRFTSGNRDRDSRREGVEATLRWRPQPRTDVTLRYALLDASEPDATGQVREIRRPRHAAGLNLTHSLAALPATLRLDVSYSGDREDQDFATFPATRVDLDAFVLVDAAATWRPRDDLEVFLRADDLLARDYTEVFGFAPPGRTVRVGFEYRVR